MKKVIIGFLILLISVIIYNIESIILLGIVIGLCYYFKDKIKKLFFLKKND